MCSVAASNLVFTVGGMAGRASTLWVELFAKRFAARCVERVTFRPRGMDHIRHIPRAVPRRVLVVYFFFWRAVVHPCA